MDSRKQTTEELAAKAAAEDKKEIKTHPREIEMKQTQVIWASQYRMIPEDTHYMENGKEPSAAQQDDVSSLPKHSHPS